MRFKGPPPQPRPARPRVSIAPPTQSMLALHSPCAHAAPAALELLVASSSAAERSGLAQGVGVGSAEGGIGGPAAGGSLHHPAAALDNGSGPGADHLFRFLPFTRATPPRTAALSRRTTRSHTVCCVPAASSDPACWNTPAPLAPSAKNLTRAAVVQVAAHARMLELAEASPVHITKAVEAMTEQYKAELKPTNDKYMEAKRRAPKPPACGAV